MCKGDRHRPPRVGRSVQTWWSGSMSPKQTLAMALVRPDGKRRQKTCANSAAGHAELLRWLGAPRRRARRDRARSDRRRIRKRSRSRCMTRVTTSACSIRARSPPTGRANCAARKRIPIDAALIADYVRTQAAAACGCRRRQKRGNCRPWCVGSMRLLDMQTQELNRLELAGADRAAVDHGDLAHLDDRIAAREAADRGSHRSASDAARPSAI